MTGFKLWTVLFLCVSTQGFFLSFLIASRKRSGSKRINFYLSAFIGIFSLIMLFWVAHWNDLFDAYDITTFIYRPIPLLLGPFLFFYIKSFFERVNVRDGFHLIPFIVLTSYFMPAYFHFDSNQNLHELLWAWDIWSPIVLTLNTVSILFYTTYLFLFFDKKRKSATPHMKTETLKLIRTMIIFFGIFSFAALINLWIRMTWPNHPILFDIILSGLISIFIYFIGYLGFNSPKLMLSVEKNFAGMYSSSGLKATDADHLISVLITHLEKDRPYLAEDYKISQLSSETNISSHHISELLNKYLKKNFSNVINSYRIDAAKEILRSEDFSHKKISSVGFEVGFSSPSTFYSWFKKLTGTSPAEYHKNQKR